MAYYITYGEFQQHMKDYFFRTGSRMQFPRFSLSVKDTAHYYRKNTIPCRKKQNLGKAFEHAPLPFHLKGMEDIKRQCNIQTEIDHVFASCLSNDILFSHQESDCNQQKHHQLHVHHILKCHF